MAVDTLDNLLALHVTPASEQDRTGQEAEQAAAQQGIQLVVVKLPEAKKGFVLLPRRWVIERSNAWMARFRRLARDYERLPDNLQGLHFLAFAILMLTHFVHLVACTSKCITVDDEPGHTIADENELG